MTTSIILTMIEPMCELFYKDQKTVDIQNANKNTFRNYGFSTSFAINFGFEPPHTIDLNNIILQPGVFTNQNQFSVYPNLEINTSIGVSNNIVFQDLPTSGIGTVNYVNKILPIQISIHQGINSVLGVASSIMQVPYDSHFDISQPIIRSFESNIIDNSSSDRKSVV